MKKLILPLCAACSLLTGCIAVPVSDGGVYVSGTARSAAYPVYRDNRGYGYGNGYRRDRDGDGVPNRWDRRPNNPYRY